MVEPNSAVRLAKTAGQAALGIYDGWRLDSSDDQFIGVLSPVRTCKLKSIAAPCDEGRRFVGDLDRALKPGRQRAGRSGVLDAEDLDARPREAGLARQPDRGVAARDRDDEQRRQGIRAAVVRCR